MRAGAPFGEARDRHLAELDARDRRLAYALAAGVLRRQGPLDRTLDLQRADRRLHDILRLGAYQLRFLSRVPAYAAVGTSVELARTAAGEAAARYVNRALRALARQQGNRERGAVASHPPWLVRRWRRQFGADEAARLVAWNDTKPPLILQPARWSGERMRDRLRSAGICVEPAPFDAGVRVLRRTDRSPLPAPSNLPGFEEGGFIVQDAAQALLCRFAALPSGALVYDACAAPGGKA
ncbi:MAG: transcription antitermination factor NusB, partial [Gemmatimonadales bacterium]